MSNNVALTHEVRETSTLQKGLAAYFSPDEVEWKPQSVNGNRALAVAYIDARCVMDRLDSVAGPENWKTEYTLLEGGCVVCRLSLKVDGEWVTKADVGGESDQKDHSDRTKAAFSDALKRAAVQWGIGRYLYSLPKQWVDFDPQKKHFAKPPQLPGWALPKQPGKPPEPPKQEPKADADQSVSEIKLRTQTLQILEAGADKGKAGLDLAFRQGLSQVMQRVAKDLPKHVKDQLWDRAKAVDEGQTQEHELAGEK